MLKGQFVLPAALDYTAAFLFALTGGLVAYEKDYDFTGLAVMALAVGLGGGIIRDGIFLQQVPAAVANWRYLAAVAVAVLIAVAIGDRIEKRLKLVILLADAAGLGLYAVVGAQKSINLGLTVYAAGLIGIINATGGGMLRDVLSREDPAIFQPGQLYAVVATVGVAVFLALGVGFKTPAWVAAVVCIAMTFMLRVFTVWFDIRTHPVHQHAIRTGLHEGVRSGMQRMRARGTMEDAEEQETDSLPSSPDL
jgi:uncharacterized membrane protein YeiH